MKAAAVGSGLISPTLSLESAVLLGELLARSDGENLSELWDDLWRRRFTARLRIGHWLQALLLRPVAAEASVRVLKAYPFISKPLLAMTRGG